MTHGYMLALMMTVDRMFGTIIPSTILSVSAQSVNATL